MENSDDWQRLLEAQENVFSRRQALEHGLTDERIEADVAARRSRPLLHGVYAAVTGDPTPSMWRRAALLFVRGPAVLSHTSAADLWRLPGARDDGRVHVTVPYGSSARGCERVTVHRSRAFDHIVQANCDPPLTTKVQTLIDIAVDAPTARQGMRRLTAGAAVAKMAGTTILEALESRPPRRYGKALGAAARRLVEGVESVLEDEYATEVELAHGLPVGVRQVARIVDGRRRAEDIEYRMPGGTLTVRIDGWRYHANQRTAHADRARDNAAELEGRSRLTFGHEEIHGDPCTVARTVATRLTQLEWDGALHACEH
ncbi:hypothetical protein [Actinomycetospora atypica]|uniref:Transcriptional regulator, AbiEi antitoxin, Type IV TA system n=1 Tax=Actinomycetospora atypica TaxID=1290095 RepID=A0ABV9YIK2_9PSEU